MYRRPRFYFTGAFEETTAEFSALNFKAAEARLGRELAKLPRAKGARAGGKKDSPRGPIVEPRDDAPTLAELGVEKKRAARAQRQPCFEMTRNGRWRFGATTTRRPRTAAGGRTGPRQTHFSQLLPSRDNCPCQTAGAPPGWDARQFSSSRTQSSAA